MNRSRAVTLAILFLICCATLWSQQAAPSNSPAKSASRGMQAPVQPVGDVFYPDGVGKQALDAAFQQAQEKNRRVLAIYGGAWCAHCAELQKAMQASDSAKTLREGYVSVQVAVTDLAELQEFALHLDTDLKLTPENGPLLTIVDKNGKLIEARLATRLLDNGAISPVKVAKFLDRFAPLAPARDLYEKGLAQVRSSGKLGFVEFGADWCVWCHHMDKFFEQSEAAPILQSYYIRIPIDYERNEGAAELAVSLGAPAGNGLPLWAVVDADGKSLANSDSPKGNIGFPGSPEEIAEFVAVVQKTAKDVAPAQLVIIQKTLEAKPAQAQ